MHALRGAGGPGRPRLLAQGLRRAPVQLVQQALLALAQLRDRRLPACQLLLASMRDISAPRPSNVSPPASRMRSRSQFGNCWLLPCAACVFIRHPHI